MSEDGLDDLAKQRLKSDFDGVQNVGARVSALLDNDSPSNGEFFNELRRRGFPEDVPETLLRWPMAGLIHGAAALLDAGLEIVQLFEAVTKFYDAMGTVETAADFDIEEMFDRLELSCACASPICPRSPYAIMQITGALASCFASLEALLPDFDVPELADSNASDGEKTAYNDACGLLYKQHRMSVRTKVLAIIELNLIFQLKAGIIQAIKND